MELHEVCSNTQYSMSNAYISKTIKQGLLCTGQYM